MQPRPNARCREPLNTLASLEGELAGLLPAACGVAAAGAPGAVDELFPEELSAISRTAPRRQGTFAAGRIAARRALAKIQAPASAIPIGATRAPVWPADIIGSIAHTDDWAIAAVARSREVAAVGVDLERADAVTEDLWPELFVETEITFLRSLRTDLRASAAAAIFSLKEAFYKFQHPHTNRWLEFRDVCATIDVASGRAVIEAPCVLTIGPTSSQRFAGTFGRVGPLVISAFALPA